MKVLVITNLFPNSKEPTRGIFNFQQIKELMNMPNLDIKVMAPIPHHHFPGFPYKENINGIDVYHPRYFMIPKIGRSLYGFLFFFSLRKYVKNFYQNFSFDLIFATWAYPDGFGSFLIARALKKPIVIKVHGSDINIYTKHFLRRKMISYALRKSDKVVSVSNALKRRMVEIGVPEDKIVVIPNGVNNILFHPMDRDACRRKLNLPLDKKIVLFIGNLLPVKGVKYLLNSFKEISDKISDVILIIVGNGRLKYELLERTRELGLSEKVRFFARQPHEVIPYWINSCDVFCLPSLNEGCPNVILEAIACGKPIVATAVGGVPEIVLSSLSGILVKPNNSKQLAQGLQLALEKIDNYKPLSPKTNFIIDWKDSARKVLYELERAVKAHKSIGQEMILYHHRTRGQGVEGVHIRGIVNALSDLGNKVIIISPPAVNPLIEQKSSRQFKSKMASIWKWVSKYVPQVLFELLEIGYNLISYVKIKGILKKQTIKAIYERYAFFGFSGALLAKRHKIPFILEVNEISGIERQRGQVLTRLAKWLEKRIFQHADAIIAVSSFLRNEIVKIGIEHDKVYVLPNAIDIKDLTVTIDVSKAKEKINLNEKFVLTFVGSFCRWDRLDFLVETFGELCKTQENLHLILVGDGKERKSLEQIIFKKGLSNKILLTGKIERKKVLEYISATDICVIPHTNPFGSPVVLFEYMGLGRPVIAPRLGPIEDIIVDNRNGIVFEPLNRESLKNRILQLINDPKKGKSIGATARYTVLNDHLWIKNGTKIMDIINSLKVEKRPAPQKVKVPILIYHNIEENGNGSVYTISTKKFREHLEWLHQEGYAPITLSELASWKSNGGRLPKKPIIITFDDGYRNCYKIAFPMLKEHGFQASFFITTKWMGKENYMEWQDIKTMKENGMEVGSHGHSHIPLSKIDRYAIKYELENSKLLIEEYLRDSVEFVSVPGGYFNNSIKQIAKEVGYKGVLTSAFGTNDRTSDLYALRRIGVRGYYTPQYLDRMINDKAAFNYKIDYFARFILKRTLGDRGYRWFLKHCFGLV